MNSNRVRLVDPTSLPTDTPLAPPASAIESWTQAWVATHTLITTRQNVSPRRLEQPGPSPDQLTAMFSLAAAAPDHGRLMPWRFVVVPLDKRVLLAEAFALALIDRDPGATLEQIEAAREKAYRAPLLMLAIATLAHGPVGIPAAERLVSLGAAIQNLLLGAQALGFGAGLSSGRSTMSVRVRSLFDLAAGEDPVCFVSMGTPVHQRERRERPHPEMFVTQLQAMATGSHA